MALLTPKAYLEMERAAETKSEYYRGEVFAMDRSSFAHSLIVTNLIAELVNQLKKRDCMAYASNLRLEIESNGF